MPSLIHSADDSSPEYTNRAKSDEEYDRLVIQILSKSVVQYANTLTRNMPFSSLNVSQKVAFQHANRYMSAGNVAGSLFDLMMMVLDEEIINLLESLHKSICHGNPTIILLQKHFTLNHKYQPSPRTG